MITFCFFIYFIDTFCFPVALSLECEPGFVRENIEGSTDYICAKAKPSQQTDEDVLKVISRQLVDN